MFVDELIEKFQKLQQKYNFRCGQKDRVETNIEKARSEMVLVELEQQTAKEAVILLEHAGQGARELIVQRFKDIVTFALQSVFGEDYRFDVDMRILRNTVWADFRVLSAEFNEPVNPLDSRGGGVVDICSLALRVVLLELFTPRVEGPLLLDEPTKQLSAEYAGRAAELLTAISERTGRQIILVTHDQVLSTGAERRFEI